MYCELHDRPPRPCDWPGGTDEPSGGSSWPTLPRLYLPVQAAECPGSAPWTSGTRTARPARSTWTASRCCRSPATASATPSRRGGSADEAVPAVRLPDRGPGRRDRDVLIVRRQAADVATPDRRRMQQGHARGRAWRHVHVAAPASPRHLRLLPAGAHTPMPAGRSVTQGPAPRRRRREQSAAGRSSGDRGFRSRTAGCCGGPLRRVQQVGLGRRRRICGGGRSSGRGPDGGLGPSRVGGFYVSARLNG